MAVDSTSIPIVTREKIAGRMIPSYLRKKLLAHNSQVEEGGPGSGPQGGKGRSTTYSAQRSRQIRARQKHFAKQGIFTRATGGVKKTKESIQIPDAETPTIVEGGPGSGRTPGSVSNRALGSILRTGNALSRHAATIKRFGRNSPQGQRAVRLAKRIHP